MDRKRYPKNWEALSLACREKANWTCEKCGKTCIKPGEDTSNLSRGERTRKTLQAAHKYHDISNPRPVLIALCTPCHLTHDRLLHAFNTSKTAAKKRHIKKLQKIFAVNKALAPILKGGKK